MSETAAPSGVRALREQARTALRDALAGAEWESARACSERLLEALPRPAELARNTVLVAYGGGKDSAYTIAFVRAMQLELAQRHDATFRLRVVTNRHAGMPHAVMRNVERTYAALRIEQDPDCETLLVDADELRPFHVDAPRPAQLVARNRQDILMTGHRTFADGRPTFCNACNLSVANAFGIAASADGGVDLIITGDSPEEQRAYVAWIRALAQRLGIAPRTGRGDGFGGVLATLDEIGRAYFGDIYGEQTAVERGVAHDVPATLRFFSIYDDTAYASGDHWELLTGFLGFTFDELAFSFTESDCANPGLMAHLRGLKAERVFGRSYAEGLDEYVRFALGLMRRKEFPDALVSMVADRYRGPDATERMRAAMRAYAEQTFGLSEEQLVCMVHSPFAGAGSNLAGYLAREQPALAAEEAPIRALLGHAEPLEDPQLAAALERISGLELGELRTLYGRPLRSPLAPANHGVIGTVLEGDPHKAVIATRHAPDGPAVQELISGR